MDGLWSFAKSFLNMFPPDVKSGNECFCLEIQGKEMLKDVTLKKVSFSRIASGMAALKGAMNRLEDEEQTREVLDAPEENFRDETYCCHDFNRPPHTTYFS